MANPALNEKTFSPERLRTIDLGRAGTTDSGFATPGSGITEPADRADWRDRMTLDGVVLRGLILFPILLATGWFGWQSVEVVRGELGTTTTMPGWLLPVLLVGFGIALLTIFKPKLSPYTAPAYAAAEGLVLGAISHLYEARYEGIVLQAVMLTGGVFVIMLWLYSKRII